MLTDQDIAGAKEFYERARLLAVAGREVESRAVFAEAVQACPKAFQDPEILVHFQREVLDGPTTRAYYRFFAEYNRYLNLILTDCPLLGGVGPSLSSAQESLIERILAEYEGQWETGALTPAKSGVYDVSGPVHTPGAAVIVCGKHISLSPRCIESDLHIHLSRTLSQVCPRTTVFYGEDLLYDPLKLPDITRTPADLNNALAGLEEHVRRERPELVVLEANFIGCDRSITREDMARLKAAYGFKLVALIPDLYPPIDNFALYWAPVSDLILSYFDGEYLAAASKLGRTAAFPSLCFDPACFTSAQLIAPEVDVTYVGSRARMRDMFCAHLEGTGLSTRIRFTNRVIKYALTWPEYFTAFRRAKMTLNSGLAPSGVNILTGRSFEAILSGSLLLQHETPALRDYLAPFIHYVPFLNVPQMVAFARYFAKHEDRRLRIVERAGAFVADRYAPERHWRRVFKEVF